MVVSKEELASVQSLRGNAGWVAISKIFENERISLTKKLIACPAEIGQIAKLQGAINLLEEIQTLIKP